MAVDLSEYRQNTHGAPVRFVDPCKSLADNSGSGTSESNTWNWTQAKTNASAGMVVGVLPVNGGTPVRIPTTASAQQPAFNPTNSGSGPSVGQRIVFTAKYAAIALSNVASNANRSELRTDAVAPTIVGGVGAGDGCAAYGSNGRSYLTYDGLFVDMAQAYCSEDSGVIRAESCTGVEFRNFEIKGATLTIASNPVIYRPNGAVDTVLSNFRAYDFINNYAGSSTPQEALFSDQYGDQNFTLEHFEIWNTQRGIFLKGTGPSGEFNYGMIRFGLVYDVSFAYGFNDLHATNLTTLHHCLGYNIIETPRSGPVGVRFGNETSALRRLLVHHCTIAKFDSTSLEAIGALSSRKGPGGTTPPFGLGNNIEIRDNLFEQSSGSFGHGIDYAAETAIPGTMTQNYNGYYKNGSSVSFAFNGEQYSALTGAGSWNAATGLDLNSTILSTAPFVDRTNNDFRIAAGHAIRTAGSDGEELGCYGTSEVIGVDTNGASGASGGPVRPVLLSAGGVWR